jgi:hypothetical protein
VKFIIGDQDYSFQMKDKYFSFAGSSRQMKKISSVYSVPQW